MKIKPKILEIVVRDVGERAKSQHDLFSILQRLFVFSVNSCFAIHDHAPFLGKSTTSAAGFPAAVTIAPTRSVASRSGSSNRCE